jgi:hypothetical protein
MAQNSSNQDYQNNADGAQIAGGTVKRILKWLGANITLTGSGSNTYSFPVSSDTLLGRDSTDTVTNKTIDGDDNTISNIRPSSRIGGFHTQVVTFSAGTGSKSVTGVGFRPKHIKVTTYNDNATDLVVASGSATDGGSISQASQAFFVGSGGAVEVERSNTAAFIGATNSGIVFVASVTSFDADGITVNLSDDDGNYRQWIIDFYG